MRAASGFHLFDTAIGPMAIAFSRSGIAAVQLPERDRDATRSRLVRRIDAPEVAAERLPPFAAELVSRLVAYAAGDEVTFADLPLDLDGTDTFDRAIWQATRDIGYGRTLTYGEVARNAGHDGLAREAGAALGRNPVAVVVPCHRVVAAGGKSGGFSAHGGRHAKLALLALEGAHLTEAAPQQTAFSF